ncbi:MAG TPA: hypothetical protein G4O04_05080 [Anaerolineae bacterium]|nr:hypothetical protein [Anaerolineae bacterium]HID84921.1 hypothetical protein [Anaerolineales bacterium]HIQ08318.1 hypothetical protein [Anaerolineaceae bacterium]
MPTLLLHLPNEEPIVGEVDDLPSPQDTLIVLKNPRRRDGKDVHYIEPEVTTVLFPINRVTLIEVLPSLEEQEIIGFVRE